MTDLEELENAVINLPADKLFQFSQWFEEFMAAQWDNKIEADILAGRLDKIAQQVDDDFNAGRVQSQPKAWIGSHTDYEKLIAPTSF